MTKAKRIAVASRRRRKRIFRLAKGFTGDRKNHVRLSTEAVRRAMANNYRHRKHNKRNFRRLWIARINAAARINGMSYSKMINGLLRADCQIDRKMLAFMAISDPAGFAAVAGVAQEALLASA